MNQRLRFGLNIFLVLVVITSLTVLLRQQLQYHRIAADQAEAEAVSGVGSSEAASLASLDLSALREVNPDVAGWLLLPGADVSQPVLQGEDNDYYLKHSWERKWSSGGAIFLDYRNSPGFDDFHAIIYGHRMNNGSMFGSLQQYEDPDFWRENPSIYLASEAAVYRYDIFAVWEPGVTSPVYGPAPETEEERRDFALLCRDASLIDTGIVPGPEDRLLTLSTCVEKGHDTRWVVQAVLTQTYELK